MYDPEFWQENWADQETVAFFQRFVNLWGFVMENGEMNMQDLDIFRQIQDALNKFANNSQHC